MANLRERRPRMALLGVGLGAVCLTVLGLGALSATAQSPPKGMSTKQPGAPPETLEELRKKGFKTIVKAIDLPEKGRYYRVVLGPLLSRAQADSVRRLGQALLPLPYARIVRVP